MARNDGRFRCIIMGAAGRDFHVFQTFFRDHPEFRVCCFTAAQIPFIDARSFPRELAGSGYDDDIPIHPESELPALIRRDAIDFVFFAYSDLSHAEVMHRASLVQAAGASFVLLGPRHTELVARRPVIAVTAARTGAGKSPISQYLAARLRERGLSVGVVRHPMPYGDLRKQRVQRFGTLADLTAAACTVEEREEYTPYVEQGQRVYAGVDYAAIVEMAAAENDVILWDGGNNDTPFVRANLTIVVLDALRPGHEREYYPGETNLRTADVIVINKVGEARPEDVARLHATAQTLNPRAPRVESDLVLELAPEAVRGRRVLVVEDGPTLTHGGMAYGAGTLGAERAGAVERIDPRPHAVGSIRDAFRSYPHLDRVLPALGYGEHQLEELRETIERSAPEVVVDASPAGLSRVVSLSMPCVRVRYRFAQRSGTPIEAFVYDALGLENRP